VYLGAAGPIQLVLLKVEVELWPLLCQVREDVLGHVDEIAFLTHLPLLSDAGITREV